MSLAGHTCPSEPWHVAQNRTNTSAPRAGSAACAGS
jgi:hypothetical protein